MSRLLFVIFLGMQHFCTYPMGTTSSPKPVMYKPFTIIEDYIPQPQDDGEFKNGPADTDNPQNLIDNSSMVLKFDPEFEIRDSYNRYASKIPVIFSHGFGGSKQGLEHAASNFQAPMVLFNYADARKTTDFSSWWSNMQNFDIGQELDARAVLYITRIMVSKNYKRLRFVCHSRGSAAVIMALYMLEKPELYAAELDHIGLNQKRIVQLREVLRASDFVFVHPLLDVHHVIGQKPAHLVQGVKNVLSWAWQKVPNMQQYAPEYVAKGYNAVCYAGSCALDYAYVPVQFTAQMMAKMISSYKMGSETPLKILNYFAEQKLPYHMLFFLASNDEVLGNELHEPLKLVAQKMNVAGASVTVLPGGPSHNEFPDNLFEESRKFYATKDEQEIQARVKQLLYPYGFNDEDSDAGEGSVVFEK